MKFIRALTVAALFAALFVLVLPVHADCGDSDPTCLLEPPVSVEIRTDSTSGDASMTASESGALVPLDFTVPMPLPQRVEAPLVSTQSELESTDSIPDFTTLAIPMRYQAAGDVSCGVQALGMALEPLEGVAPSSAAMLDFLREHQYLYDFGTGVEELALAAQTFGYSGSVSFHNWTVEDLQAQLADGHPVVIGLGANGSDEPGHFVALTGISPDGAWAAYSDPLLGERMVPLDDFLDLWALQGYSGVAVAEAPPAPLSPDYAPWAALAATMMATLALAPSMLSDVKRRGVGGILIAEAGSGTAAPYIGMSPPYAAPAGMKWVKGAAVYETHTRTEIVYNEVPKKELQKVQVGTSKQKIPYTKRILVDNGRWVTDYKSERYIRGYRNKRILDGYRTRRYVKYYRTRLVRTRWGYTRRRTPVYGTKRTPVYRNLRVPIYGTRKVPNGRHWDSKWEHEEYTEYKTVVRPVYEDRWVNVGVERIPEELTITERELKGHSWGLIQDPNYNPPHDLERFPAPTITWIEDGSRPSWIEQGIWNSLSAHEKGSVFAEGRAFLLTWWEWVVKTGNTEKVSIDDWLALREDPKTLDPLWKQIQAGEDRIWTTVHSLNVRDAPMGNRVGFLVYSDVVRWTGKVTADKDGDYWYQITYTDAYDKQKTGWVSSSYMERYVAVEPSNDPHHDDSTPPSELWGNDIRLPQDSLIALAEAQQNWPQYISLDNREFRTLLKPYGETPRSVNFNLCGFFDLAASLGIDLLDLLRTGLQDPRIGPELAQIIANDETTTRGQLQPLLDFYGRGYENSNDWISPIEFAQQTQSGRTYVALTGVDSSAEGTRLTSGDLVPGGSGHWVMVTGVVPAGNSGWVRLYNSLSHQMEILTFEEFNATWGTPARDNNSRHLGFWINP